MPLPGPLDDIVPSSDDAEWELSLSLASAQSQSESWERMFACHRRAVHGLEPHAHPDRGPPNPGLDPGGDANEMPAAVALDSNAAFSVDAGSGDTCQLPTPLGLESPTANPSLYASSGDTSGSCCDSFSGDEPASDFATAGSSVYAALDDISEFTHSRDYDFNTVVPPSDDDELYLWDTGRTARELAALFPSSPARSATAPNTAAATVTTRLSCSGDGAEAAALTRAASAPRLDAPRAMSLPPIEVLRSSDGHEDASAARDRSDGLESSDAGVDLLASSPRAAASCSAH